MQNITYYQRKEISYYKKEKNIMKRIKMYCYKNQKIIIKKLKKKEKNIQEISTTI